MLWFILIFEKLGNNEIMIEKAPEIHITNLNAEMLHELMSTNISNKNFIISTLTLVQVFKKNNFYPIWTDNNTWTMP